MPRLPHIQALCVLGMAVFVASGCNGCRAFQTSALAIYDAALAGDPARADWLTLCVSLMSVTALWLVQRTLPARGQAV
jgi:hypothetical protein